MTGVAINALREAIVAALKANLPGLKSVEAHGGTFDLDELKRHMVDAPCVRVCVTGHGEAERHSSGGYIVPVHIACVIITRDVARQGAPRETRDQAALAIATALSILVAGYRFDLDGVWPPENLKATNEYSGAIDETGAALWQATWDQPVLMGETREDAIAALSQIWINGEIFEPGSEPANDTPLAPPFATPAPGVPLAPQPGEGSAP